MQPPIDSSVADDVAESQLCWISDAEELYACGQGSIKSSRDQAQKICGF